MKIEKEFLIFKRFLGRNRARPTCTVRARPAAARPQRRNTRLGSRGARLARCRPSACSRGPRASEASPAQRPLGALERAVTAEHARRAASAPRPAASGYRASHGKVFTVSTQGARRTCLTWSELQLEARKAGDGGGGADRHGRRRRSSTAEKM
jgi:hypothetical protein